MNPLKKLAGQTAIYGLPTIVGRLLSYLLTPIYTYNFIPAEYGIVTSAYAFVSFLNVFLTYGMETALFRFSQHSDKKDTVFTTSLISVSITSVLFVLVVFVFAKPITDALSFKNHVEYVKWFSIIVATDAIAAIPFAKLREQANAKRFAFIKTFNIALYITLNMFFIVLCPLLYQKPSLAPLVEKIYAPNIGIGYIFISNLIASVVTLLMLLPVISRFRLTFDTGLWKTMMRYGLPLLIAGLAGTVNETSDRILLTQLLPEKIALKQTGIYGACYKVSIIMSIFIQTFRFAAEPFFFSHSKEKNTKDVYARVMLIFVIFCCFIFLGTMMNMQWIQYFAGTAEYREGIKVVPILLMANMFLGIYFNLSIWYKLSNQTYFGALFTILGAVITIVLNIIWIPTLGYVGSAWATLICYLSICIASYFVGNKHYPVNYDLKRIGLYIALSLILFFISTFIKTGNHMVNLLINNIIFFAFVFFAWKQERHLLRF